MNSMQPFCKESATMDEQIKEHLKRLNKYYLYLRDARKIPLETFVDDALHYGSTERFLQLAIESCLNIGNRLISLYQFKKPVDPPETYADIFSAMQQIGVLDYEFSQKLRNMAKFRNRLVHLYWEIERKLTYQFIQEDLEDFKTFESRVVDFLKNNPI